MHIIDKMSDWAGRIASYLVLVMAIILIYEIVVRTIFKNPTLWGYEMSGMVFGGYCILVGAYAYLNDAHVRMDVLYGHWQPSTRAKAEVFTSFLTIVFLFIFLWLSIGNAWESFSIREYSGSAWGPPLFPLKTVICIGVFLILLQSVAHFIRTVNSVIKGKYTS